MKKRIIIIVLLIVIISLVLFKIFLGHLDIRLKGKYNNPIYRLQLNDKYYGMNMEINYNINIIPQTLTFIKTANLFTSPSKAKVNFGDKILLNITGYNCFLKVGDKESQTSCADYNHKIMKEIENLKFTKMKIMGGSEVGITNDLIYDGDYVNDLTNIITKKGKYQIEINLEHKPISSVLIFILEVN